MRLFIVFALCSQTALSQPISIKKLILYHTMCADSMSTITSIKQAGFNNVFYDGDKTILKGSQSVVLLYKTGGCIDAIEYRTLDSSTYKSWDVDLKSEGFEYRYSEKNYSVYSSDKYTVMAYKENSGYSLAVMERVGK